MTMRTGKISPRYTAQTLVLTRVWRFHDGVLVYFERLMRRAGRQRHPVSYCISYSENSGTADSILEVLPSAVVVEYQRPDDATIRCIHIPYARITRCQVGRFAESRRLASSAVSPDPSGLHRQAA